MTIARELVTLLRYQVDKAGLSEYQAQAQTAMGKMRAGIKAVGVGAKDAFQGFNLGIRDGIREHRALNAVQEEGVKKVQKMGQGYSALTGYIRLAVGAFSVQKLLGYIDSWGQMESRMKQATASAQEYAAVDKDLARISRLTYKSYSDNAELFVRTRRTMADLGKTTQDTVDVTEALSLGMVLSSTKAQDTESVIGSLSKAIMQNKLGMEEYSTLMRAAPRLQTALADGLGVTTGKLLEMVKAGNITTDKMLPALQTQLAKMRIEAEGMPVTVADAFTVLNDAAQRFFGKTLTAGRWAVLGITKSIEFLADNIETIAKLIFVIGSSLIFPRLVGYIGAAWVAMRKLGLAALLFGKNGRAGLLPFLRLMAVFEAIRLVADDILGWFNGYQSVLGDVIGDSKEWQKQIDWVKKTLEQIKDALGGGSKTLGDWISGWGYVAFLAWGVSAALKMIGINLVGIAKFFIATPFGQALAAIGLIVMGLKWCYDNADKIADRIRSAFGGVLGDLEKRLDSLKEKFSNLIPEGVKGYFKENLGGNWAKSSGDDFLRKANESAGRGMGTPQSYRNNESTINQEITINAPTNNPAALARMTGDAVGRRTNAAVNRSWGSPNVEAMA